MIDHKNISLADQVYEVLETDILSGKYARGDVLTEGKLCEQLGVSRTPIREALRRLEQEGLIKENAKGSLVLGITQKDLDDIFIVREKLEGIAASLAASNSKEEEIEKLKSVLELQEFYLQKHDAEQIKVMDNKFHETLYNLSGSVIFHNILLSLHKKIQKYRKASMQSKSRATESVAEHRNIFNAIAAHDPELAEKCASQHVKNAYQHIIGKD